MAQLITVFIQLKICVYRKCIPVDQKIQGVKLLPVFCQILVDVDVFSVIEFRVFR